jgi:dihydroorotase
MGVPAGTLDPGAPADLCIFDPDAWWTVERGALQSQGKNTPFLGLEVQGRVRCTIAAGQIVHQSSDMEKTQ